VADTGRIALVVTSPRVAPGLLAWPAWEQLRAAETVLAADPAPQWLQALDDAAVTVEDVAELPVAQRAGRLVELAAGGASVAWFGSPDGDPGLTDALAEHLARHAVAGRPPAIELVTGSHDLSGARLLDLVAVMDMLRSPGGCPWDAEQTHTSLLPYLLEETHEVIEAVEHASLDHAGPEHAGLDHAGPEHAGPEHAGPEHAGPEHLVEELGDLLLQVMFHARIGEEHPAQPFDIDDVAAAVVAKMVRRHPHVFAEPAADATSTQVSATWEELKAEEKGRTGPFEGIPASLPALARAGKMLDRLSHAGADLPAAVATAAAGDELAAALLAAVLQARGVGVDPEAALRTTLARLPES
jgi:XTP/dITP diphosphohydrolase